MRKITEAVVSVRYLGYMVENQLQGYWLPIQLAPDNCDLQLGTVDKSGIVPWRFPCRKNAGVWFNVWANEPVLIHPTHWRSWR